MSERDLNFKKVHPAVNLREDWSGFRSLYFLRFVCVFLATCIYVLCMISECGWITARFFLFGGGRMSWLSCPLTFSNPLIRSDEGLTLETSAL